MTILVNWDKSSVNHEPYNALFLWLSFIYYSFCIVQHLIATKRTGKIINISSVHEELPFPNFTAYCASKGGMKMLARNLAVELGALGITINNVAPGAIETPINTKLLNNPEKLGALLQNIPLGRLGQPQDIAFLVAFLASTDADYITGGRMQLNEASKWSHYWSQLKTQSDGISKNPGNQ